MEKSGVRIIHLQQRLMAKKIPLNKLCIFTVKKKFNTEYLKEKAKTAFRSYCLDKAF